MELYAKKEQARAEKIRHGYENREADKLQQLKKLDRKVKAPGEAAGTILGIIGSLTMGAGMAFVMVWENMTPGLIFGIAGMIVALLAYPVYKLITGRRKKSYVAEIMRLSDEIVAEREV